MTMPGRRRLPAEWEPQDGVLLAWPHDQTDWRSHLAEVEPVFIEIAREVTRMERLLILTPDDKALLEKLDAGGVDCSRVAIFTAATNDTWARDFGPITVMEGKRPFLADFGFNGWGLKFPACHDNRASRHLHRLGAFGATPLVTSGMILEGGSIDSDGAGTLLTTAACLLGPNRNPQLAKDEIERALASWLGAERILWLHNGLLEGDDTDAHIDTLARFCPDDTICYVACDDPGDAHYESLTAMAREIAGFRTRHNSPYRLLPLPWPSPQYDEAGNRLPATYANFLVLNEAVLVPTYGDPKDALALAVIREAFPGRRIIGIYCLPLIREHGALHCLTMQIPKGVLP